LDSYSFAKADLYKKAMGIEVKAAAPAAEAAAEE
jgi:hypothetical protein